VAKKQIQNQGKKTEKSWKKMLSTNENVKKCRKTYTVFVISVAQKYTNSIYDITISKTV
jgi:hypothetical protein